MKSFVVGSFVASFVALGLMSSPALADLPYANLTGHYICMKNCQGMLGHSAYVTQNGWDLNLLTETNQPVRASTDWFSPNRIWVWAWNGGAVYSPDGQVIQFDNGMIWRKCHYYHHHCHFVY